MSDFATMSDIIDIVNDGLAKYYAMLGVEYDDLFKEYCKEHGFDDLEHELHDIDGCLVWEFDDEFPFGNPQPANDDDKKRRILDIIWQCHNPDVIFEVQLPQCCVHLLYLNLFLLCT